MLCVTDTERINQTVHKHTYPMKTTPFINKILPLVLIASIGFTACKDSSQLDKLTDEEIKVIVAVAGETLGDQTEGFMTDVYDVQRNLNYSNLQATSGALSRQVGPNPGNPGTVPAWRRNENNVSRSYNPETGVHTFSYDRTHAMGEFSKSMSANLNYQFLSPTDRFIQFPGRDTVETVRFNGVRSANMTAPGRSSIAERSADWVLSGLSSSNIYTFSGTQSNSGEMTVGNRIRGTMSREFSMRYRFVDVTIQNQLNESDELETLVSGTMTYEIDIKQIVNGEEKVRQETGSVDLTGDGKAVLRIMGLRNTYRINLATGEVQE
jgi:hypothetical protein